MNINKQIALMLEIVSASSYILGTANGMVDDITIDLITYGQEGLGSEVEEQKDE